MEDQGNRNTILTIIIVLAVSIVALIVVISFTWRFIAGPIEGLVVTLTDTIRIVRDIDYRFPLSLKALERELLGEEQAKDNLVDLKVITLEEERTIDYRFETAKQEPLTNPKAKDAVFSDADRLVNTNSQSISSQKKVNLIIPKIGLDSSIFQGLDQNYLEFGPWLYPSTTFNSDKIIVVCSRTHFSPNDPRSCWDISLISKGDNLYLNFFDDTLVKFEVVSVEILDISETYSLIGTYDVRLVSTNEQDNFEKRFVINAKII